MLVKMKVLLQTKIEHKDFPSHPGHTLPQAPNTVCGKFTHMKPMNAATEKDGH